MGVVVVGVDGSDRSVPALEWAANEAAAHGHTLRVVTAWSIPVTALSPGGLPAPIVSRLNGELTRIFKDPELQARADAIGFMLTTTTPEEFAGSLKSELATVGRIVKGDATCLSISAASILAKVTRDRLMRAEDEHEEARSTIVMTPAFSSCCALAIQPPGPHASRRKPDRSPLYFSYVIALNWRAHSRPSETKPGAQHSPFSSSW